MTELENLRNQKFVLECKDHWTIEDWAYAAKLDQRILELDPPKPKQVWFEVRQVHHDRFSTEFSCGYFPSKEAAETYISKQLPYCDYYVKEA